MRLSDAHIARIHKVIADQGPPLGMELQTDADYAAWVDRTLQANPRPGEAIRLFAYGSLIWKPEIDHVGTSPATAHGWHRSFCLKMPRFRGTPQMPGLMMVLDRGGQCRGMMFTLPKTSPAKQLDQLFRREFTFKPINNVPRWIKIATESGPDTALAFVVNRTSPLYRGSLPPEEIADVLAQACGHWGTGAEYLMNTVAKLEAAGIQDRRLWQLQDLVAARIEAATGPVSTLRP
jgi:glutathione-specific gamma-glutamylcyclotransferase